MRCAKAIRPGWGRSGFEALLGAKIHGDGSLVQARLFPCGRFLPRPIANFTLRRVATMLCAMSEYSESPLDRLWKEYGQAFRDFDDLTLARWLAQTLSQLAGRSWRLSHPLLGAYRLAAQLGHERQIWLKRLTNPPATYREASCCRAPLLPLFTRDVLDTGLICQHCGDTVIPFDEIPAELQAEARAWAEKYAPLHAVAHWNDAERKRAGNYDGKLDDAAEDIEQLLAKAGGVIVPKFLDHYPAMVWEDQDECLEVRPEDVAL